MAWGVLDLGFDNIFGYQISVGGDDPRQVFIRDYTYNKFNLKNCISLDVALKEAKDSLAYLKAEKLNGYKMTLPNQPLFIQESLSAFREYMTKKAPDFYKTRTNVNEFYGKWLGDNLLHNVIKTLENKFVDLDCRNEIEQKRLEESGMLLTKQSAVSESNVLPSNYKEQYLYIGLGSLVLLVGLYVITKK
jgi:hypothetical protein